MWLKVILQHWLTFSVQGAARREGEEIQGRGLRAAAEGEGGRQAVDRTVQSSLSASDMIEKVRKRCSRTDGGGTALITLALPRGTGDAEP